MKKINFFLSFCLLFTLIFSCIKKKETNDAAKTVKTPVVSQKAKQPNKKPLTAQQIKNQKARRAAWKNRAKTAKANQSGTPRKVKKRVATPVAKYSVSELKSFKKEMSKPVALNKNKGNFLQEIAPFLKLTHEKVAKLDELVKKYQRKGMDFKFFGAFYKNNNSKPFAKELATFLTPLEVENFKHFHSYWFDRVPYPKPDMPTSLFYRLNLSKGQFSSVSSAYSEGTLGLKKIAATDRKGRLKVKTAYEGKIAALLNNEQKKLYNKIIRVSY